MPKKKKKTTYVFTLRQRSEDALQTSSSDNGYPIKYSPDDMAALIHDLQIHQTEIEMQNDELKRSQEELDTERTRYLDFFNMAPVGFFSVDEQKQILECNLTAATLLGRSQNEIAKQQINRFILKEDQDIYYLHNKQVFETEMPQGCDLRMLKKDGSALWVNLATTVVQDAEGATVTRIVMSDITDRKRAEDVQKDIEERYRITFDAIPDALTVTRLKDGRYQYVNDGFCEITGYSRYEVIDKTPFDISLYVHQQDREKMAQTLRQDGELLNFEIQFRRKDDTIYDCFFSARPIVIDGEDHLIALSKDVTEMKKAEKEKAKLENQLRQAQKMESVGRLAGGVAHDFNNMLGVILGNIEIVIDELDSSNPLTSNLEEVQKAAQRSTNLTRQLLTFARKQIISPKVLDLNDTIEGMLKMLKRLIGEDIHLSWKPAASLWRVKVDSSQIDQILANLCVNARDSIKDVGTISIKTNNACFSDDYCKNHEGFKSGEFSVITVSDNGGGMDKKTLNNIFEPFFTTKDFGDGTGLGLATVYGILKQNNGFINVYSEYKHGTTFKVCLPRHAEGSAIKGRKSIQKKLQKGYETILLVEDEKAILEMAKMMLERMGYTVLAANTPDQAIQISNNLKSKIDLLFTDVVMPIMNGNDLAKNISQQFPNIKCLFMSGYTADVIAHRGILDDGLNFINKPFSSVDLAIKLREILDEKIN